MKQLICQTVVRIFFKFFLRVSILFAVTHSTLCAQQIPVAEYKKKQEQSYKRIFSEPQKARIDIQRLLNDRGKVPDSTYAMTWNLLAIYCGVNNLLDSAHYAIDKALLYLPDGNSRKMALFNNKAIIYRKQKKFDEGFLLLDKAEKYAIQYNDSLMLGTVIGERASYFSAQNIYSQASVHLLRSIAILEKLPGANPVNLHKEKQKLANMYSKMGEYALSEKVYKQILPFFKKEKEMDTYYISLINLGDVYLRQNRLAECESAFKEGLKGLQGFPNREMQIHSLERIAELHSIQGKDQLARQEYKAAYKGAGDIQSPRLIYFITSYADALVKSQDWGQVKSLLAEVTAMPDLDEYLKVASVEEKMRFNTAMGTMMAQTGQEAQSVAYFKNALSLKDSFHNLSDIAEAKNIQLQYHSEIQLKENQILQQQNQLQRLLILIVVILMVLFSSFLIWKWYIHKVNLRIKSIHLDAIAKEKNLLSQKLSAEQELVQLKEQIINEHRNDLMVKNIENIRLSQQLAHLLERIDQKENESPSAQTLPRIDHDHWEDIIMKFKQLNPEFVQKLREHSVGLSKGDIEFCSMARMNMSNKDIARVLNISLESVRTKKYRLMKKLSLPDDANFYHWIMTL